MTASFHKRAGFTLVEIMTVVVIVGILSTLSLPAIQAVRHKARNSALVNDLRTFEGAFQVYRMETGSWPPDQNRAIVPPEMTGYISASAFSRETPIGGNYDWDPSTSGSLAGGISAAISVRSHNASDDQVDALLKAFGGGSGQLVASGSDIHFVLE